MVFFEDFIKKVEKKESEYKECSGVYKYGVELLKKAIFLGTGIPLILVGIFQAYEGYIKNFSMVYFVMAIVFIYLGSKNLKIVLGYKIILDLNEKKLIGKNLDLTFDEIESCILKEAIVGKSYQPVIALLTKDKKEIIIPLIMNRKVEFVSVLKSVFKEKFKIIKN